MSSALVDMWKEAVRTGKGVPEWLSHVSVEVIITECGLQTRQQIFGDHNVIHHATTSLSMGQVFCSLVGEMRATDDEKSALITAVRTCGKLGFSTNAVCLCMCRWYRFCTTRCEFVVDMESDTGYPLEKLETIRDFCGFDWRLCRSKC